MKFQNNENIVHPLLEYHILLWKNKFQCNALNTKTLSLQLQLQQQQQQQQQQKQTKQKINKMKERKNCSVKQNFFKCF
jgi:hypothetical protein